MEYVAELASRLGRNLVFFDIEHTGGAADTRRIIEFGAYVVDPHGRESTYSSLISVPRGTVFNPYAMRANKINRRDLVGKPSWQQVYMDFVQDHSSGTWVGFNSNVCDTPIIQSECRRHGLDAPGYQELDLMRNPVIGSGLSGSLSERLKKLDPLVSTHGMHRALKDAWMTMALFEALLKSSKGAIQDVLSHLGVTKVCDQSPSEEPDLNGWPAYIGSLLKKAFEGGASLDELADRFNQPKKSIQAYLIGRGLLNSDLSSPYA